MSLNGLNHLNSGLMLLSVAVAAVLPFELFLFAYAILGPAHYLTQISWLHDRNYFTTGRWDFLFLLLLSVPLALRFYLGQGGFEGLVWDGLFGAVALVSAAGMVWFERPFHKIVLGALGALCAAFLCRVDGIALFFSLFVPSLVHVYLFTGAFIAYGNLKSRALSGWISMVVFVLCGGFFFVVDLPASGPVTETIRLSMERLAVIPREFITLFGMDPNATTFTKVMRFIAFAYTYHYLNWFTKTRVIGWGDIPRRRALAIVGLWLLSVGVFILDYRIGVSALFTLSLVHVFLEFPLNHRTFAVIGSALAGVVRPTAGHR
ncbi:MAG: hypothetical protein HN712_10205 [Gemmatimonadetes bacterium]|jgi:hypothetical protein|nr:hypothetical protein [Gemmatimonadota bacterium]MBT7860675.1 hypothetical protein [Gemmatimonadota bacterium]